MSWTNGTWADVAIGDTVLGGDGYPWSVTDEEPRYAPNGDECVNVTIEREGRAPARSTVRASKSVKYRKVEPVAVPICPPRQIEDWESVAIDSASNCPDDAGLSELHADSAYQGEADLPADLGDDTQQCPDCLGPILKGGHECPPPKVAPYVEYDESERAAASALKGAGLTMTVIERVMTLDGLIEHLERVHGKTFALPGTLTRIEYRSRLADLHFELHAHDQERGQKWAPRGRTPHVHPVMDRPMEDATPKSLTRRR